MYVKIHHMWSNSCFYTTFFDPSSVIASNMTMITVTITIITII